MTFLSHIFSFFTTFVTLLPLYFHSQSFIFMKFIIIIPARYASTRFPGKPLALIDNQPMIWHVYQRALTVSENVWVATDDERILSAVEERGGRGVLTSANHQSGTDRCYEAFKKIGKGEDVLINIQGDEPFVRTEQIKELMQCFLKESSTQIATLARPFDANTDFQELFNPNHVKVNFNLKNEAIYFSRAILPYVRNFPHTQWLEQQTFFKHIGMYAYRTDTLKQITELPQSPLEKAESLEQLRWIENGFRIKLAFTSFETIGIDTPNDLEQACQWLKKQNNQSTL